MSYEMHFKFDQKSLKNQNFLICKHPLKRKEIVLKRFFIFSILALSSLQLVEARSKSHKNPVNEKPFVIGSILGQLGNRMFEVATACALAWDNNAEPYFPDFAPITRHSYDYNHIFFRCNIHPPKRGIEFEWGSPPFGYDPIPYHPNMKISGYFQNEKYFAHHRNRLLNLFAPHPDDLKYIQNKYGWIIDHPNAVSVHLRYYYTEKPGEDSFIQYEREYFEKAMALFPESSLFVVTSDNLNFARQNIPTEGKNVIFIEGEPYYIDFFLQSLCKHNIICNSTFSWWSAWLNRNPNKIVVRPKVWFGGYPDIGGPDEWIKIDALGLQAKQKRF